MNNLTNINIDEFTTLIKPNKLREMLPLNNSIKELVIKTRKSIEDILSGKSNKKIFIVGPCSIHNIDSAKKYGDELKKISNLVEDKILIVMRVYFEKPRTTVGWKGLINDPHLDNTYDINYGLSIARELLIYLNDIGLPCGCEFLDVVTPQYISDLISWGAIGARTVESQVHRQMVSGMSMPVGFKNSTSGSIKIASDAILSAMHKHCFMGITDNGEPAICKTKGNKNCHVILRGGDKPNYDVESVSNAINILKKNNNNEKIMIDCSHGNSGKDYKKQSKVFNNIINQIKGGNNNIIGIMLESNINEGNQKLIINENNKSNKNELKYGVSITDSCISIDNTKKIILQSYIDLPTVRNFFY